MKKQTQKPINFGKLQLADGNILNLPEDVRKTVRLQNKELFRDLLPHNKTIRRLPVTGKNGKKYIEQLIFQNGKFVLQNVSVAKIKSGKFTESKLNDVLQGSKNRIHRTCFTQSLMTI